MRKIIFLAIILVFTLALSACGESNTAARPDLSGDICLAELVANPAAFVTDTPILLTGYVASVSTRFFFIQNEEGTALLMIDYRGSNALPDRGEEVSVQGVVVQNCCDPSLIMLMASSFTRVEL